MIFCPLPRHPQQWGTVCAPAAGGAGQGLKAPLTAVLQYMSAWNNSNLQTKQPSKKNGLHLVLRKQL